MALSPEDPTDSGDSGQPALVQDDTGAYVAQNEDQIYEEDDWEWLEASQFIEAEG